MNDQYNKPSRSGAKKLAEAETEGSAQRLKINLNQLEQLYHQNVLLNEMGNLLQGCLLPKDVHAVVGQYSYKLFAQQSGCLYRFDSGKNMLETAASWGESGTSESFFRPEDCWALRLRNVHIVRGADNRLDCKHFKPEEGVNKIVAYLCAPLISQNEILGVLHQRLDETQSMEDWEQLAILLVERISLALANLKLKESLMLQSIRDSQTNLFSRYYMEETLERELLRAARHRQPLGIIMIEVDNYKLITDEKGIEAGDTLMREMSTFIQSNVRGEDVACRFGVDQFAILFPEVSLGGARKRAEQICYNARNLKIYHQNKLIHPFSISVGVASFPVHATNAVELLWAVETGLNQAIKAGCNRVEVVRKVE